MSTQKEDAEQALQEALWDLFKVVGSQTQVPGSDVDQRLAEVRHRRQVLRSIRIWEEEEPTVSLRTSVEIYLCRDQQGNWKVSDWETSEPDGCTFSFPIGTNKSDEWFPWLPEEMAHEYEQLDITVTVDRA